MLLNITSAIVQVPSEVQGVIYECRAVGSPQPLEIIWRSGERGDDMRLRNSIAGVQTNSYEDSGETVGVLLLYANFTSISCTVTNSASNGGLAVRSFRNVDSTIGVF